MYLLPKNLDYLNELIGQDIDMVCVGPFDAQIIFEKGIVIQAMFKLDGEVDGKKSVWLADEKWVDTSHLSRVPKQQVIQIVRASDKELQIKLSNNVVLCFYTEEYPYESILIRLSNGKLEVI